MFGVVRGIPAGTVRRRGDNTLFVGTATISGALRQTGIGGGVRCAPGSLRTLPGLVITNQSRANPVQIRTLFGAVSRPVGADELFGSQVVSRGEDQLVSSPSASAFPGSCGVGRGGVPVGATGAPTLAGLCRSCSRSGGVFMALSLIVVDGFFVIALAAWWQLRRSAYLLPHLRRGPSAFVFHPGRGLVAQFMAIIVGPALLTFRARRPLTGRIVVQEGRFGHTRLLPGAQVPTRTHTPTTGSAVAPRAGEWSRSTVQTPVAAGLHPLSPSSSRSSSPSSPPWTSGSTRRPVPPTAAEPRCPVWTWPEMSGQMASEMSGGTTRPSAEPPTCPFPVVGPLSPGHGRVPQRLDGPGCDESPTRPTRSQQPALARRGPV